MREYATALEVAVPGGNLTDDVVRNGEEHADDVVVRRRVGDPWGQQWVDVTAEQFLAEVRAVAKGLLASGIEPGDRVGLMSRTRYEWTLLDYAIWFAGAVSVPLYESSSTEQVGWALRDCGARAVVVETREHASRVQAVRGDLQELHQVWALEHEAVRLLGNLGADVTDEALEERRRTATPDDVATIIYTSGTTGPPRGCVLSHANLLFELTVALDQLGELFAPASDDAEEPVTLLFLPLAHVFARVVQVGAVRARVCLAHSHDVRRLTADLQEIRPTFVLAVPRVFEKVFNTASQRALADGRGRLFDRAAATAISWSRAQDTGRTSLLLRARHRVLERLVYAPLREGLGGRCRYAVSGGAPLGERLGHFFRGCGITVLEGYGLTESTAALTVNTPPVHKIGTVGRPLPGTAVRVSDEGELLFRGGQVFSGYWGEDPATSEVLDEQGWLHTGDLGEIDDEGFVRVTGRQKEIIVTAGGKNVSPNLLEDRLRAHVLVDQALVVGDGQPFVAALLTLDPETLPIWAEQQGRRLDPGDRGAWAALAHDPDLRVELQRAVDQANETVSQAESVRSFSVVTSSWSEEGGQLTPSLKLRRSVVLRQHRDDIDALFQR